MRFTCVLPGQWEVAAPSKPRLPQPRAPRCGDGRRPVSEAGQVPSMPAEAVRRCPQVRQPGWRRSLGRLFGIPAWVVRCGAAPRDRHRGPLGKGGAAVLLPGLPQSWVLPACGAPAPAATPVSPASSRLRGCPWSEPVGLGTLLGRSVKWTLPPPRAPAKLQTRPRPVSGPAQPLVAPPLPARPRPLPAPLRAPPSRCVMT